MSMGRAFAMMMGVVSSRGLGARFSWACSTVAMGSVVCHD
jgi:hypothetical protein